MFHKFGVKTFGVAASFLSVSCTTAPPSIFRTVDLDSGRSISTDASQRLVINTKTHPTSRPGRVNPERIVCAEPSPDVASIVANTFGAGINILGKGNGAFAAGQSTALAQLAERTITVQLLRDQMYRACEAYSNGAISGTEYSLLMSRNNDAMVTLMLGETASRTVGRQLAALTAEASSDASARMPDLVTDVAETKDDADNAEAELAAAKANKEAADKIVQDLPDDASDEAKKNAEDNASKAQTELDEKQKIVDAATEKEGAATEKLVKAAAKNETSTDVTPGGFVGGIPTINADAVNLAEHLGRMQKEYLDQGSEEHMISACLVELGNSIHPLKLVAGDDEKIMRPFELAELRKREKPKTDPSERPLPDLDRSQKVDFLVSKGSERSEFAEKTDIEVDELYSSTNSNIKDELTEAGWAYETYYVAQGQESDRAWGLKNKTQITKDRLRTFVALDDREQPSALAQTCAQWLPSILKSQSKAEQQKLAINMLVDLERVRAGAQKKSPDNSSRPVTPATKKKKPTASEYVAEYVRCDAKSPDSEAEACRIEKLATMIAGTDVAISGNEQQPSTKKDPKSGSHVVQLSSNKDKAVLEAEWKTIKEKHKALLNGKTEYYVESGSGTAKIYGLRIGPYKSDKAAKKFCSDSKRAETKCVPTKLK